MHWFESAVQVESALIEEVEHLRVVPLLMVELATKLSGYQASEEKKMNVSVLTK